MKKLIPGAVLGTIGLVGVGLLGLQTASADDGAGDPKITKREENSSELATVDEDDDDDSTDKSKDKTRDKSKQSKVSRYQVPAQGGPAQDVSRDVSRDVASRNVASRNVSRDASRNVASRDAASRNVASKDVSRSAASRNVASRDAASRQVASKDVSRDAQSRDASPATPSPAMSSPATTRATDGGADGTHRGQLELRRGRPDHVGARGGQATGRRGRLRRLPGVRRGHLGTGRGEGAATGPGGEPRQPAWTAAGGGRPRGGQPPGGGAQAAAQLRGGPAAPGPRVDRRATALHTAAALRPAAAGAVPAARDRHRLGAAVPAAHRARPPRHQAEQRDHGRACALDRPLPGPHGGGGRCPRPPDRD